MQSQGSSILSHLVPNTEQAEQKYIGYLIQNPIESYIVQTNEYSNASYRIIVESLKELQINNNKIDYDSLLLLCRKKFSDFDQDVLYKIYNQPKNFDNIELFKKEIVEGSIKRKVLSQMEDLLIHTTDKKFFDIDKFQSQLQDLLTTTYSLEDSVLLTGKELKENYEQIREKRKQGIGLKSLGYEVLNKKIKKPGAPGEISGVVSYKGGGKSTFVKNIEQKLITKRTCVVSINLEMTEEANMDRFQCMKTGFPIDIILSKNVGQREESQINRALDSWENIPNYLYYTEPELTLNQFDGLMYKSKQIFKNTGSLPEDEYIFVTIDLLTMVREFSESDTALNIEKAVNKFHSIVRKHKCHAMIVLQANENKLRGGRMFTNPNELDRYKVGLEDIKNSAAFSERCRVVMSLCRPVQMKKRFFPEQNELWGLETDFINLNIVKQNDGDESFIKFVFNKNFRIYPWGED